MDSTLSVFSHTGVTAFPAGLASGCVPIGAPVGPTAPYELDRSVSWRQQQRVSLRQQPFPAWRPKEASVHPMCTAAAAGVNSAVDNTMRLSPVKRRWGLTRQASRREEGPLIMVTPAATLAAITTTNADATVTLGDDADMPSVLPKYAPAVSLFDAKYEPSRLSSGFIASPTRPGAGARPTLSRPGLGASASSPALLSLAMSQALSPSTSPDGRARKYRFDMTAGLPHIPVARRALDFVGFDAE